MVRASRMKKKRRYPQQPMLGIGGVVIFHDRVLLVRRGSEPLKGEWSIPGGILELGESLGQGVERELREETGLTVRVRELLDVFERIFPASDGHTYTDIPTAPGPAVRRPLYHFVVLDYLCEVVEGIPRPGSDVTDVAFVREDELADYRLTPAAMRVLRKAFKSVRARRQR